MPTKQQPIRLNLALIKKGAKQLTEEKLDFSRNQLVFGNLAVLGWILLAFLGLWFYSQIGGWLMLAFNAFLVYGILRRLGCGSCYLCKSCTSGFGRIAGAFFGTGQLKKGSVDNRKGTVAFVYLLLFPLPTAFLSFLLLQEFNVFKVLDLVGLLAVSVYSAATWRKPKVKA
jgi:hypothetical protein